MWMIVSSVLRRRGGNAGDNRERVVAPRYPRRRLVRRIRQGMLVAGTLYLTTVAINVYTLIGHGLSQLRDINAWVQALLLPSVLTDQTTPGVVVALFIGLLALLLAGALWATADLRVERRIMKRQLRALAHKASAPGRPERASLLIIPIERPTEWSRAALTKDVTRIGRGSSNDVVLGDPTVSRDELAILRDAAAWRMERQRGAADLYLNGAAGDRGTLRHGDQLVSGHTVMRFELPEPVDGKPMADATPQLTVHWPGGSFDAPLRDATITLGRAPDRGIVVPSDLVSLHHAILQRIADGNYQIVDDESRNGLWVDGKAAQRHTLRDQDVVTIGAALGGEAVTLQYTAPPPAATDVPVDMSLLVTLVNRLDAERAAN